jgi:riboflavin transporter FmnP
MADITLVEGLFEMCEKHFGKTATKLILGLVLATVIIGCLGFILGNFIIPTYHIIGVMIQDREHIVISRRQVFDSALNACIAAFLYLLLYWICTFPARRMLLKFRARITK